MSIEQRVDRIEEAILIMKNLVVSHDERLENYFRALQESREDFNFKLNALVDAQMRNEMEIQKTREDFGSKLDALTDAQMKNETAIQESRKDFDFKLNASSEDFNFKLDAVIDLQMRNEIEIRELKEASKSQLGRIEKLENK